jgi:pilus assembly protein CpaC
MEQQDGQAMSSKSHFCASLIFIALCAALIAAPMARADQPTTLPAVPSGTQVITEGLEPDGSLTLSINRSKLLITGARLRSADKDGAALTEGSPEIAAVDVLSPNTILVTAKKPGSTNLLIEDELGRRQSVEVRVEPDLSELRQQLSDLCPQAVIDVHNGNGTMILRGHVPSLRIADQAAQVTAAYAGTAAKVVNLLEISGGQQVMLEVKFAEVSKSVSTQLGINFGYTDGKSFVGNNIAQVNPSTVSGTSLFNDAIAATPPGAAIQFFGNGSFGHSAFNYFINCLRQNTLMRTLADPNLTAISGEQASFQVGGQIPVPVPQPGGGSSGSTITIQYENYGIILHFTPIVLGDGRIRLKIDPEVSSLDYAHGVTIQGFNIPGFTTRTVDTTVELADGQTFTIAGLLSDVVNSSNTSAPGLGDVPVLGALFRSVSYQRNQTELVVMVTPRLVEAVNPQQVAEAAGERWRYPSEADLFLARDLGGQMPSKQAPAPAPGHVDGPAPQFRGQYGFTPTSDTLVVER